MRKLSYWLCFTLVGIPSFIGLVSWMFFLAGKVLPGGGLISMLSAFASPVPVMLSPLLPRFVVVALSLFMLALVLRRTWLLTARKQGVPASYAGVPKVLGYIGAWSFLLASTVLVLSMLLRAGSGVPAGMLFIPAVFCVPWAFLLTEVFSLRGGTVR